MDQEHDLETRWQHLTERFDKSDETDIPDELLQLARAVAGVEDEMMTCEECETWLPTYVDEEVGGLRVAEIYPEVKRHLDLCDNCASIYVDLLELAQAEEVGEIDVTGAVPVPDLSFLSSISFVQMARDIITQITERILNRIAPAELEDLSIIGDIFFEALEEAGGQITSVRNVAPVLGFDTQELSVVLNTLMASYETTRRTTEIFSTEDIQTYIDQQKWGYILAREAKKVGQELMNREEAQIFAQHYAAAAQNEIDAWLSLATHPRQTD